MAIRRRGHFGAWRAVCALPALCGSLMVLAIGFGWLGVWANLVLAGWLLAAAALLRRRVERVAVPMAYGYRRPNAAEAAALAPLQAQALRRCGLPDATVDWYVRRSARAVTGYAAGGWSVAVSAGLLEAYRGGRLSEPQAVAILTHDLLTAPTPGLEVNARAGGLVGCA
jgi:STE24 endopeptidase